MAGLSASPWKQLGTSSMNPMDAVGTYITARGRRRFASRTKLTAGSRDQTATTGLLSGGGKFCDEWRAPKLAPRRSNTMRTSMRERRRSISEVGSTHFHPTLVRQRGHGGGSFYRAEILHSCLAITTRS